MWLLALLEHCTPEHLQALAKQSLSPTPMSGTSRCLQAAGTADTLRELGAQYGMRVQVTDLLGDANNTNGNVSSSEVGLPACFVCRARAGSQMQT